MRYAEKISQLPIVAIGLLLCFPFPISNQVFYGAIYAATILFIILNRPSIKNLICLGVLLALCIEAFFSLYINHVDIYFFLRRFLPTALLVLLVIIGSQGVVKPNKTIKSFLFVSIVVSILYALISFVTNTEFNVRIYDNQADAMRIYSNAILAIPLLVGYFYEKKRFVFFCISALGLVITGGLAEFLILLIGALYLLFRYKRFDRYVLMILFGLLLLMLIRYNYNFAYEKQLLISKQSNIQVVEITPQEDNNRIEQQQVNGRLSELHYFIDQYFCCYALDQILIGMGVGSAINPDNAISIDNLKREFHNAVTSFVAWIGAPFAVLLFYFIYSYTLRMKQFAYVTFLANVTYTISLITGLAFFSAEGLLFIITYILIQNGEH